MTDYRQTIGKASDNRQTGVAISRDSQFDDKDKKKKKKKEDVNLTIGEDGVVRFGDAEGPASPDQIEGSGFFPAGGGGEGGTSEQGGEGTFTPGEGFVGGGAPPDTEEGTEFVRGKPGVIPPEVQREKRNTRLKRFALLGGIGIGSGLAINKLMGNK